ncbi:39S ribosomal protein L33 like [Verticillium longisporum]|uniref:39S ribosomal protein L33 like n=3 Tax=Verticillium longisporum TaxID=100787 RepID=A0A8I3AL26_VERLO|nr:39S ribosomal protein L33 like [Verticillium longisporum]KAG7119269.1 39S ribosomal protein L33 like [Verticillium longisporum]
MSIGPSFLPSNLESKTFPIPSDVDAIETHPPTTPTSNKTCKMAKKTKARVITVRLLSMAMTGFFYTFNRARTASPMSMLKYDPIIRRKVLFLEQKRKGR